MKKILLPVDGSIGCQKVLDTAEEMAKKFDSTVTVFNVCAQSNTRNTDSYIPGESNSQSISVNTDSFIPDNDDAKDITAGENIVDKTVEFLSSRGIKAQGKVVTGEPAPEILDEAANGGYDLVVMCTHGMSTSRRFLLGSVTNKVVHHIDVPIMVIR